MNFLAGLALGFAVVVMLLSVVFFSVMWLDVAPRKVRLPGFFVLLALLLGFVFFLERF